MSATLGKNPVPTGSAAAYQIVVHSVTNVHSTCPWYIKCKLGYNKKQKSKAIKQVANAIKFDETFYYERWDPKEILQLSVWKEKNKLKHVAVASLDLQCPSTKQYPSSMYELKTELFPVNAKAGEDGVSPRARANTALEGDGIDANKPCGEITITVTHVPGYTRWQQHQANGTTPEEPSESKGESKTEIDSQQSKKAELMKAAAEHKAEKESDKQSESKSKPEPEKPAEAAKPAEPEKPAEAAEEKPAEKKPAAPPPEPAAEKPAEPSS